MARTRVKNKWASTFAGALVLILVIGAVVALTSIGNEDKTTVTSSSFSVGGISTQTGKGINASTSVYTEDRIACQGLSVVPSFSCSSTYQIFFYNDFTFYYFQNLFFFNFSNSFNHFSYSLLVLVRIFDSISSLASLLTVNGISRNPSFSLIDEISSFVSGLP